MNMYISTTKMSSHGQVVIPEEVRNSLGLKEGTKFIIIGQGDSVILKSISLPSKDQFKNLASKARKSAKKVGLKKAHLKAAIQRVRKQK